MRFAIIGRFAVGVCAVAFCVPAGRIVHAQDVPGIEICTVEKTMERRTSCLQSNIEFLQKTIAKLDLEHRQKLDAANRQIEALKANLAVLQKVAGDLQAAQQKMAEELKKKLDAPPPKNPGVSKDAPSKNGASGESAK
jgi:TolA-binding protein